MLTLSASGALTSTSHGKQKLFLTSQNQADKGEGLDKQRPVMRGSTVLVYNFLAQ